MFTIIRFYNNSDSHSNTDSNSYLNESLIMNIVDDNQNIIMDLGSGITVITDNNRSPCNTVDL